MQPLISVIVPIYRVELYLRKCIDSLLAQTYQNLEIILVDDGSPDNCPAICDEYAAKDNRIRVIHKENGGLSDARNVGLDAAHGEYIGFVDSDDWIMPDMYEYLYHGAQGYEADIVVCEYYNYWPKKSIATYRPAVRKFEGAEAVEALLFLKIGNYAWNKLYKRELWSNDIRYPKGKLYEDVCTTYKLVEKAHIVVALPEPKYYYRRTGESITGTLSIKNKMQCVNSRIERFIILTDRYPKPRAFMLKEIHGYLHDLRKAICQGGKDEFEDSQDGLQRISTFLRDHENEICQACNLGRLGRLSYRFMTEGNRGGWLKSATMERIISAKGKLFNYGPVKNFKSFLSRWKENEKKRYYYKICSKYPLQNAAFVESRGGEDLAGNMFEVAQELCHRGIKVYLSVKRGKLDKVQEILKTGDFPDLEIVEKWSRPYYKAFATSKYWFNDMVFEDTIVKRLGQIYVNTWHGTPLKMLEFDVREQRHNTGGASRDFLKCDYLVVPSKYLFEKLLTSSCTHTLFSGKALYSGYPRNSIFFDDGKRTEVRLSLGLAEKEVFVYMPTWRGNLLEHSTISGEYSTERVMEFFETHLKDNQVVLVKLHNYEVESINYGKYSKVVSFPSQYDTYSVLNIADCLITDYSSVFFDFANTRKKIILFTHDREEYLRDRGLYLDLEALPFPKVTTYEELAVQLNTKKDYDDSAFIHTFCTYDCADSAQKMIDFVLEEKQTCKTERVEDNKKENILIYDTEAEKRTKLPAEIERELNIGEINYFYCYPQWLMKSTPLYLKNMCAGIYLFTLTKKPILLWTEKLVMKITGKKVLRSQVKREQNRQIYGTTFDEIRVIGNNKYDPYRSILVFFEKSKNT